jgi:Leucine-rich repeat (LRR) protein
MTKKNNYLYSMIFFSFCAFNTWGTNDEEDFKKRSNVFLDTSKIVFDGSDLAEIFSSSSGSEDDEVLTLLSSKDGDNEVSPVLKRTCVFDKFDSPRPYLILMAWEKELLQMDLDTTVLDLSGQTLNIVPQNIERLINLTSLDLSNNNIQCLPDFLGNFEHLTKLSLHTNHLREFPQALCALPCLKMLDLHHNKLAGLPAEISSLSTLTHLSLYQNRLVRLPEGIVRLTGLVSLSLHTNDLTGLPEDIGNLEQLQLIFLSKNALTQLPVSLFERKGGAPTIKHGRNKFSPRTTDRLIILDKKEKEKKQGRKIQKDKG